MKRHLLVIVLALIMLIPCGCKKELSEKDAQTLANAREIIQAMIDYVNDNAHFPEKLDELVPRYLPEMPTNAYTGQPMVDTRSDQFDPATSPGNLYYARVFINGDVLNYSLMVWGEDGLIRHIRHQPMAAD